ncbi:dTDP-4-dehydrorhamnose reductase [Petroclostridium sp. X23]|uniref:dTDP-4-dehydrorhamnose reductase n=1 Tax=Petroclostridium sp. X23 TaxID=3045146 RepID=UPI0024ACACB2|nr:dTDP-4-dehydrorhamnose reductase [Petroclostridium sp. X23]WHH57409.1 dTDP-4-dehydrorhamnose reductase [Petroclostridium sp. X23]
MRVLITGAKGMLGTDLAEVLQDTHEVIGVDMDNFDITNIKETVENINELRPDIVIHCAAYTNVDGCESEMELAYKVNALGPRNVAVACNEINAAMVHISTDYVFDGTKGASYIEDDATNALSVYGKCKLAGENYVRTVLNKHYIVRTQWLYGKNGKNFVKTMVNLSKERDEIRVVNDQFGSPTYTLDLAYAIKELIQTPAYGIYHITNSGVVSWYEFTKDILELAGAQGVNVVPITTEEIDRPAPRPKYSPLENFYWKLNGHEQLRSYKQALADYLEEI